MALHLSHEEGEALLAGIGRKVPTDDVERIRFAKTNRVKKKPNDAAEKSFRFQCQALRLPALEYQAKLDKSEYPGIARRRWVLDFLFREQLLCVEIDGGIWMKGGGAHSHPVDITRNMTKQNDLSLAGILVLRFTPREVMNGHAVDFTQRVLATRGWRCPA